MDIDKPWPPYLETVRRFYHYCWKEKPKSRFEFYSWFANSVNCWADTTDTILHDKLSDNGSWFETLTKNVKSRYNKGKLEKRWSNKVVDKRNAGNMRVISMFLAKMKTMSTEIWVKNRRKRGRWSKSLFLAQSWSGFPRTLLQQGITACGIEKLKSLMSICAEW